VTAHAPLHGVVVADFSRALAGPYATMLLADLGATVVKVESPWGDDTRHWGPPWITDGQSTYFQSVGPTGNLATILAALHHRTATGVGQRVERTADAWFADLTRAGVPCGPLNDVGQGIALAASLGLDPVVYAEGSGQIANPLRFSVTPVGYRRRPPVLGMDNEEIFGWLDYEEPT